MKQFFNKQIFHVPPYGKDILNAYLANSFYCEKFFLTKNVLSFQ